MATFHCGLVEGRHVRELVLHHTRLGQKRITSVVTAHQDGNELTLIRKIVVVLYGGII